MELPVLNHTQYSFSVIELLLFVWISVGLLLLSRKMIGYLRYRKQIYAVVYLPSEKLTRIYTAAFYKIFPNKQTPYRLLKLKTLTTPAAFGIIHPVILLPDIDYTEEELYYVFLHELLHIKHRHYLQQLVMDMILSVHWWNVIILFLFPSALRQIQELYVDASLTKVLSNAEKGCYLQCLLKTVKHASTKTPESTYAYYALCNSSNEYRLHQRFYFITQSKKNNHSVFFLLFSLLFFGISFSVIFQSYNIPELDRHIHQLFHCADGNIFFLKVGTSYKLYRNEEFLFSIDDLQNAPPNFRNYPVYEILPSK